MNLLMIPLSLLSQIDLGSSPVWMFVMAFLALPGVTSIIASGARRLAGYGIDPRPVVYAVSWLITGLVLWAAGESLPGIAADPSVFVASWLTWGTVNAEVARRIYELLLQYVPALAPPPTPSL